MRGYGRTEGKRVDASREQTRVGYKKGEAIVLTAVQARQLKTQHPHPSGYPRLASAVPAAGLGAASEVAALTVESLAEPGYVIVYRQKTDTVDRMELTADILAALADYQRYLRQSGPLLRGSRKNGSSPTRNQVMSVRDIGARVKILGRDILGIWELTTCATRAARGSNPFVLRDAGGWTNMQKPSRYVERSKVLNEGISLDY